MSTRELAPVAQALLFLMVTNGFSIVRTSIPDWLIWFVLLHSCCSHSCTPEGRPGRRLLFYGRLLHQVQRVHPTLSRFCCPRTTQGVLSESHVVVCARAGGQRAGHLALGRARVTRKRRVE